MNKTINLLWLKLVVIVIIAIFSCCKKKGNHVNYRRSTTNPYTRKICLFTNNALKARHKTCFLRPDTGPCRADIIQWYFDVKEDRCFRFFWGGCQGNGNRFETHQECRAHCFINGTEKENIVPNFCSLAFEYGSCFGYFNRWAWDPWTKLCRIRVYSGCGGNQNNFETRDECLATCLRKPNNTMDTPRQTATTCIPIRAVDLM